MVQTAKSFKVFEKEGRRPDSEGRKGQNARRNLAVDQGSARFDQGHETLSGAAAAEKGKGRGCQDPAGKKAGINGR